MHTHAPETYQCPFCLVVQGIENEHVATRATDLIYQNEILTSFISSHQWPNNHGHALIIPNEHLENIYELPDEIGAQIYILSKQIALAMKSVYHCDGVSTRQHNEPAGNQDVWHYHLHVFPRYHGDALYGTERVLMPASERSAYAQRLREYMTG